jgi:thiosulfate/3-mercaptopyruvate sulfurtransferase
MVIAYDDYKGPNATGVYHFFLSYGHTNVKILNGGRNAISELDPNKEAYNEVRKAYKKAKKAERKAKKAYRAGKKDDEISEEDLEALKTAYSEAKAEKKRLQKEEEAAGETLLVVKGEEEVDEVEYHIDPAKIDTTYLATKAEVEHAMHDILENGDDSQYRIVDTRSMTEIIGERKMDNVARGGHVPGSKLLEWKHISDSDRKKSFRTAEEMKEVFDRFNISTENTVYAYCQVGTGRSSEIVTALQLLGAKDVKVFAGSWDAWGNDMNLPIKR